MVTTTSTETPARPGRPRDPAIDKAILDAARDVIAERGYTGASMDAIARTAGVGKDTLYRRWDSKQALVIQLLTAMADHHVPFREVDDDPAYALFLFLRDIVRVNVDTGLGAVIAGVVGEAGRNPDLAAAFHQFWHERREVSARVVRPVVGPSTGDDELERILDHLLGSIYYRLLLTGDPVDDEHLWQLVLDILPHPDEARTDDV
jgi:AcrR family transcriptional regulator